MPWNIPGAQLSPYPVLFMLIGEAFVRVNCKAFRNELAALAVPPVIVLFLVGEDAAAGRTEELGRFICAGVVHISVILSHSTSLQAGDA